MIGRINGRRGRLIAGLSAVVLLAVLVAGCSSDPLSKAPAPVHAALDPFAKSGFTCAGPSTDQSSFSQWQCGETAADGVAYSVILDADNSGLKQVLAVVDQSKLGVPNPATALDFYKRVAAINVGGTSETIASWITSHIGSGGQEAIGPVLVTLDPPQPVSHLVLFATG